MPQFTTISPTHIKGQKRAAWERCRDGRYVAIGWLEDVNLTGKSIVDVTRLIKERNYSNEAAAIQSFERFFQLKPGDYVAINNVNHGLYGVGLIESEYRFQSRKHASGDPSSDPFYSHYRIVKWITTEYLPRTALVSDGETPWQPYGAVGKVYPQPPPYIQRLLRSDSEAELDAEVIQPEEFKRVIASIEILRNEREHKERAHESLVEDFFVAAGYLKHKHIKYRQGRVDVMIQNAGRTLLIAEVKADWNLSLFSIDAIKQAYNYAHEQGVRYILITNGDTYILFDRLKGLSYETNYVGEFKLSELQKDDLPLIDRLRPERLTVLDVAEALRHLAETFDHKA